MTATKFTNYSNKASDTATTSDETYARTMSLYNMDSDSDLPPLDPAQVVIYDSEEETTEIDSIAVGESGYASVGYSEILPANTGYYTLNGNQVQFNGFPLGEWTVDSDESDKTFTLYSTDVQSALQAFNFIRYISANQNSDTNANFVEVLQNSDNSNIEENVDSFFSSSEISTSFQKVTYKTWLQVSLWLTRDFSAWQGTYYVYPKDSLTSDSEISLLGTITISLDSITNKFSANLALEGTSQSVGLKFVYGQAPSSDGSDSDDEQAYIVNTNYGSGEDPVEVKLQARWLTLYVNSKYQTVAVFDGTLGDEEVFTTPTKYSTSTDDSSTDDSSTDDSSTDDFSFLKLNWVAQVSFIIAIVGVVNSFVFLGIMIYQANKAGNNKGLENALNRLSDNLEKSKEVTEAQSEYKEKVDLQIEEKINDSANNSKEQVDALLEEKGFLTKDIKETHEEIDQLKVEMAEFKNDGSDSASKKLSELAGAADDIVEDVDNITKNTYSDSNVPENIATSAKVGQNIQEQMRELQDISNEMSRQSDNASTKDVDLSEEDSLGVDEDIPNEEIPNEIPEISTEVVEIPAI